MRCSTKSRDKMDAVFVKICFFLGLAVGATSLLNSCGSRGFLEDRWWTTFIADRAPPSHEPSQNTRRRQVGSSHGQVACFGVKGVVKVVLLYSAVAAGAKDM